MPRRIAAVTSSRSDFGLLYWILQEILRAEDLELRLVVTGAHLSPEFGFTVREIEAAGFSIADRVEMLLSSDTGVGMAKAIGLGIIGLADALGRQRPDILLLLGDRFEILAAATAALSLRIPIAHIHGGEITEGVLDEAVRHAVTKMSHIHFVATPTYAQRVIRMGEEPWRVVVSGAPAAENIRRTSLLSKAQLEEHLGLSITERAVLVTYHPVTLDADGAAAEMENLLSAIADTDLQPIFTYPNADPGARGLVQAVRDFVGRYPRASLFTNLGHQVYWSLMRQVRAMLGNSSSGLIEAPSFQLPVVNVGDRQRGRLRAENVIDVGPSREEIAAGILQALRPDFRTRLASPVNPYGDGSCSAKILQTLRQVQLGASLLRKRFMDWTSAGSPAVPAEAHG